MKSLPFSLIGALLFAALVNTSCSKTKEDGLFLDVQGLENLGGSFQYEAWLVVEGSDVSIGTFTVGDDGLLSRSVFEVNKKDLEKASDILISIEPAIDSDPGISANVILGGTFEGTQANLTVAHNRALNNNFSSSTGEFYLASPTDGMDFQDETSGIWFLTITNLLAEPGLNLPDLGTAWTYEGWINFEGVWVSSGKFSDPAGSDESSLYGGVSPEPAFPGEDYLSNPPQGLIFPTDLSGKEVAITIEPVNDNSDQPFFLKPLSTIIPGNASIHTNYPMDTAPASDYPSAKATKN